MLSNLLAYRFLIANLLVLVALIPLWTGGHVQQLYEGDITRITLMITVLFAIAWVWTAREIISVSAALNEMKRFGAQPALEVERDKDLAKTEWLKSVSEWLVALGLLGTVIGFAIALSGIDQNGLGSAEGAQASVAQLMVGMRVALNTTILGAVFGLWHEVNQRMLRTALITYWSDRIAAAAPAASTRRIGAPAWQASRA